MGLRLLESHSQNSLILASLVKANLVGLRGLEPPTLRLSGVRSNHLSYKPMSIKALVVGNYLRPNSRPARRRHWSFLCFLSFSKERKWWRWGESNSWPPACKAGALPAELHPHFFNRARKQFRLSFHHFEGTCFSFAERTKFAFFAAFPATKAFFAYFLSRKKEGLCLLN